MSAFLLGGRLQFLQHRSFLTINISIFGVDAAGRGVVLRETLPSLTVGLSGSATAPTHTLGETKGRWEISPESPRTGWNVGAFNGRTGVSNKLLA